MILSLTSSVLTEYIIHQIKTFFPDNQGLTSSDIAHALKTALDRLEFCFMHIQDMRFQQNGEAVFNHLHSDQYAMFLYFLSNSFYIQEGRETICEKIFYLNKCLHGIDCFYTVQLPSIFLFVHPLGTILGTQASYSDYFLISQNCTIGDNYDGQYPVLGKGVALYSGATIIGECVIKDNCEIGAHAFIYNSKIASDSIVFGRHPNNTIKRNRTSVIEKHFII